MLCNVCDHELSENAIFCPKCGSPVEQLSDIICPKCGGIVGSGDLFCLKCGCEINETNEVVCQKCNYTLLINAEFCPKCGQKINASSQGVLFAVEENIVLNMERNFKPYYGGISVYKDRIVYKGKKKADKSHMTFSIYVKDISKVKDISSTKWPFNTLGIEVWTSDGKIYPIFIDKCASRENIFEGLKESIKLMSGIDI